MASDTLDKLRKELVTARAEADTAVRKARAMEQAIALLSGDVILVGNSAPSAQDFRGLGIVDAAKRFILEAGEPRSTGDIAEELLKRGMETTSKKWVATVYSTLDNSKEFVRQGSGRKGRWAVKEHKESRRG